MNQDHATRTVESLYEEWATVLVRYAFRMTGSHETADDIVQEVFLALYRDLRNDKPIDNIKAWTFGAVRNQIRKHERMWNRRPEELRPTESFDLMPAECHPRGGPDTCPPLAPGGLAILSGREEEVVLLRLQSFKYREIAESLGISAKSVCTLLARALKKLQIASGAAGAVSPVAVSSKNEVHDAC